MTDGKKGWGSMGGIEPLTPRTPSAASPTPGASTPSSSTLSGMPWPLMTSVTYPWRFSPAVRRHHRGSPHDAASLVEGVEQVGGLLPQGRVAVVEHAVDGLLVHRHEQLVDVQRGIIGHAE